MRKLTALQFARKYPDAEINENCLLNVACSTCGNRSGFRIQFTGTAEVFDDGSSDDGDHEWDENSEVDCPCGEAGKLHRFTIEGLDDLLEEGVCRKCGEPKGGDGERGLCGNCADAEENKKGSKQ